MRKLPVRVGLVIAIVALGVGCRRQPAVAPPHQPGPSSPPTATNSPEIIRLNEAIRRDPTNPDLYWQRAAAWRDLDRYDLAFPDFDEAIRLDPTNSVLHDDRGFAYHMHDREERKALADYDEAIRLDPANHHAINNRAYLLATTLDDRIRNGKQAVTDATSACEMTGWGKAGYLDTLAVAYAEVGDFEQAITWQKKALENPTFAKEWGGNARAQLELFRKKKPYRE